MVFCKKKKNNKKTKQKNKTKQNKKQSNPRFPAINHSSKFEGNQSNTGSTIQGQQAVTDGRVKKHAHTTNYTPATVLLDEVRM